MRLREIPYNSVSMAMRDLLRRMGKKRFNAGTAAAMLFLNATNPETIKLARKAMLEWGFKAQRLGAPVLAGRSRHAGNAVARRCAGCAASRLPLLRLSAARRRRVRQAEKIITDNRVLFHRVANTLNYLDIRTVVVSCGTCYDQLQG